MTHQEAYNFIEKSITPEGSIWADLGAGNGTFTYPISQLLGPEGKVYAIDTDAKVLNLNSKTIDPNYAEITAIQADFTQSLNALPMLDGIFLANALHYVQDQVSFLQQIIYKLKPNGKLVIIEYDMDRKNPWIPYPISFERLKKIVQNVELTEPIELNRKSSVYNSEGMYLSLCQKK